MCRRVTRLPRQSFTRLPRQSYPGELPLFTCCSRCTVPLCALALRTQIAICAMRKSQKHVHHCGQKSVHEPCTDTPIPVRFNWALVATGNGPSNASYRWLRRTTKPMHNRSGLTAVAPTHAPEARRSASSCVYHCHTRRYAAHGYPACILLCSLDDWHFASGKKRQNHPHAHVHAITNEHICMRGHVSTISSRQHKNTTASCLAWPPKTPAPTPSV